MNRRLNHRRLVAALSLALLLAGPASAEMPDAGRPSTALNVAAPSELADVVAAIDGEFMAKHPGATVKVSLGAADDLYRQVMAGAPYDVVVAADMDIPRRLIAGNAAIPDSLMEYAVGQLALWTTNPDIDVSQGMAATTTEHVRKLAIANPDAGAYGRAAREALTKSGLWDELLPRLVTTPTISRTTQSVQEGDADAGFVAYASLKSPRLSGVGHYWLVPETLHAPLAQGAVVTVLGSTNPLAQSYLDFLHTQLAQVILDGFGYSRPVVEPLEPEAP